MSKGLFDEVEMLRVFKSLKCSDKNIGSVKDRIEYEIRRNVKEAVTWIDCAEGIRQKESVILQVKKEWGIE